MSSRQSKGHSEGTTDAPKSDAEIMRDMNDTLKRMHKMGAKPHSKMRVGKPAKSAKSARPKADS